MKKQILQVAVSTEPAEFAFATCNNLIKINMNEQHASGFILAFVKKPAFTDFVICPLQIDTTLEKYMSILVLVDFVVLRIIVYVE